MKKQLTDIQRYLSAQGQHTENVEVTGASIDTRTLKPGDLFIPFRGESVNGHTFVRQAFEKGAAASFWLADEPDPPADVPLLFVDDAEKALQEAAAAYREELSCTIIGVTGSNGKTSTKDLIYSVLSPYFRVQKTEGNFNNELGLPLTLLSIEADTQVAVLEMGMSGFGEISFLSKLAKPEFAVITNIGEAHMQDLGSREGIAKAKFEIIDGLQENGMLFYDGDEPLLRPLIQSHPALRTCSFGHGKDAGLYIAQSDTTDAGSRFQAAGPVLNGEFTIPVYGAHQVKNSLAAILIAHELGLSHEQIAASLKQTSLTDMRMQPIVMENGALFINDAYNSAPTSLRAALQFLADTALRAKKWAVLGDMLELGTEEEAYHRAVADDLAQMDLAGVLLYGPRMHSLYDELQKRGFAAQLLWSESDYTPLIDALNKQAGAESLVLFKGSRGMALEKIIEGMKAQ